MSGASERVSMALLTAFVFAGATLTFGVEPLIGRLLLPFFGGAVHIWLTCLAVFQGLLLLGYLWAHLVAPRIGAWHLALLAVPVVALPLSVVAVPTAEAPVLQVVLAVLRAIGLPFVALATTSVVAQVWLSRSALGAKYSPYPLYAASNAGSLASLLAYPFVVEPLMGTTAQRMIWSVGYVVFVALAAVNYLRFKPERPVHAAASASADAPTWGDAVWWLVLSAVPSAFLIACTNVIASEVGSFPMVWVLPLALYLCSFMIVFRTNGGIPRPIRWLWPELIVGTWALHQFGVSSPWLIVPNLLVLLGLATLLHGDLYERRPDPTHLTSYYLWMALGGFVGGSLVTFGAPVWFTGTWEYTLLLVVMLVVLVVSKGGEQLVWFRDASIVRQAPRFFALALGFVVLAFSASSGAELRATRLDSYRNFYGVFRVEDRPFSPGSAEVVRVIIHGSTLHGVQAIHLDNPLTPVSYYHESQCIAQTYVGTPAPKRVGIVGLGAGALAGFGQVGDAIDFYEIDPENEALARKWFTFLEESPADVRVFAGDGRILLASEAEPKYHLLQVDAFSGDGIPTHLINLEALRVYGKRMHEDGLLSVHISNRYYDLREVIRSTAAIDGWHGAFRMGEPSTEHELASRANCVVLARSAERLDRLVELGWTRFGPDDGLAEVTPWTDDYINILTPLLRKP